jgi:hypothetical protein
LVGILYNGAGGLSLFCAVKESQWAGLINHRRELRWEVAAVIAGDERRRPPPRVTQWPAARPHGRGGSRSECWFNAAASEELLEKEYIDKIGTYLRDCLKNN